MHLLLLVAGVVATLAQRTGPCDPLTPEVCALPYPNDFFLADNPRRVDYDLLTFPADNQGRGINPTRGWNSFDGHSPFPMITTYFEGNVDDSDDIIPHHWNLQAFQNANSATILLDASTGARVAHFSETDRWTQRDDTTARRVFMLHPAMRLKDNTTYIVGMRSLRREDNGAAVLPSAAFQALRDGIPTSDPDVEYRRSDYENFIFPALAAQGFQRSTLQIAWRFTTASKQSMVGRLQHMRDDGLSRMPPAGPNYNIVSVQDDYNTHHFRKIFVDIEIPLYMSSNLPGDVSSHSHCMCVFDLAH